MTKEKAIKIIKEFINGTCLHLVDQEALETLIPELKESEDERIRMALVEYFAPPVPFTEVRGIPVQKVRDWLENLKEEEGYEAIPVESTLEYKLGFNAGKESEKQKEQKPIKWTDLTWKDIVELEGIINNVHYDFSAGIGQESFGKEVLERFRNKKDDAEVDACEQKPAEPSGKLSREKYLYQLLIDQLITYSDYEYLTGKNPAWSEEDEAHRDFILESLEDQIRFCKKDTEGAHYAKQIRTAQNWLKSLPERFNLQPKQEWQIKEGDKVRIRCRKDREKDIIAIYDGKVGKVTDIWDKRYPWGHIAVKLDDGCNNSFHEDELEVLDESHWKPSKEQMEAFEDALTYIPEFHKPKSNLASLLRDLKKLM